MSGNQTISLQVLAVFVMHQNVSLVHAWLMVQMMEYSLKQSARSAHLLSGGAVCSREEDTHLTIKFGFFHQQ